MNGVPSAVLLQIIAVAVATSIGVKVNTFALLDSGSITSLISKNCADAIGLVGEDNPLQLGTVNSSRDPVRWRIVSFHVGAVKGTKPDTQIVVDEAWTVPQLNLFPQRVTHTMMQGFTHLTDTSIPEVHSKDVTNFARSECFGGDTTTSCTKRSSRTARCDSHSLLPVPLLGQSIRS